MPLVLRKFPLQIFRQDTLVLRQCTTVWVCTLVMAIHCVSKCTSYKYKGLHAYIYIYTYIYICLDLDIYMYFFYLCVCMLYILLFSIHMRFSAATDMVIRSCQFHSQAKWQDAVPAWPVTWTNDGTTWILVVFPDDNIKKRNVGEELTTEFGISTESYKIMTSTWITTIPEVLA